MSPPSTRERESKHVVVVSQTNLQREREKEESRESVVAMGFGLEERRKREELREREERESVGII